MSPRDDIIRRPMLEHREHQTVYDDDRRRKALFEEAADEIERLRAAPEKILRSRPPSHLATATIARAALEEGLCSFEETSVWPP